MQHAPKLNLKATPNICWAASEAKTQPPNSPRHAQHKLRKQRICPNESGSRELSGVILLEAFVHQAGACVTNLLAPS
jgi:hypothetical protein